MGTKDENNYHSDISKIAKNAGITGLGEIIFNLLAYVTSIIITRTVGPAIFGVFNLANNVTNTAQILSNSGPGHGLLRFVAYYKGKGDTPRLKGAIIFGTKVSFSLSLFFTVILFYSADYISINFFHNRDVGKAIKILLISLPFLTLGNIWLDCIQSFQIIKYQVYSNKIIQPVTRLTCLAIFFLMGLKLAGILAASIISTLVGFSFILYYLLKIFPVFKKLPHPVYEKKEIINFSLPISLAQYLGIITLYADSFMLGYFKNTSDVGIYVAAVKFAMLIELPLISFNTILGPMISEFYAKNEMRQLEELFKVVTKWVFALSLPLFLIFVLFAKPIMGIFGEGFVVGAIALIIFGGAELINAGTGASGQIITMTGRPIINTLNALIFGILNIILNFILIPKYGIYGASIATGSSIAIINILKVVQVYFFLRIHPYNLNYLKPFIAGLLSFLIVFTITYNLVSIPLFTTALLTILFLGLYSFFIYLFKLEKEDTYVLQLIYQKLMSIPKA
ncbi:flippase [candidate division WS5 bacterium]|uniref:Flippase n=1 Tax=candidate division WS5 bacterium TaxID=2093353 RepID=A0A419DDF3_9BACT|nr:MAG: flippase [candidate division WS5 bacterium]